MVGNMTIYLYRVHLGIGLAAAAAAAAAIVADSGQVADANYFTVRLSANGGEPASAIGASAAATSQQRDVLKALIGAGFRVWVCDAETGNLLYTNHAGSSAFIGQAWSWAQSLAAIGLQEVQGG